MELLVGARTSEVLGPPVRAAIDESVSFKASELETIFADHPLASLASLVPLTLLAEVATAAFFGLELFSRAGRPADIECLAQTVAAAAGMLGAITLPEPPQ